MRNMKNNLQLFANAGDVVTGSESYVNASTGVETAFDNANSMSGELKLFYDTELLENAREEMFFAQLAKRQPLPRNHGTTVEWRKFNTFDKASELQEGVIPTGQKFGMTTKTGSLYQMGTYTAVTDRLDLHACDPVILAATQELAASAAETQETLIRDALLANTNVFYCDNVTVATGEVESTPTLCSQMKDTAAVKCYLTPRMVAKAVTKLKKDKAPKIKGKYFAVIHPSVAEDLRNSQGWVEAHKYASPEEIFKGEIGELHGCRFIENVFAPVLDGEDYVNAAGGKTYATFFFGKDSFGIVDPEGGGLETIVKDKSEIGGPLEQFATIGYKFETNGATILYPERLLRVMSCSSYSTSDDSNYDKDFVPKVNKAKV